MNLPYYTYSDLPIHSAPEQWVSYSQSPAPQVPQIDYAGGNGYHMNFADDTAFDYNHGFNTSGPEPAAAAMIYEGYPLSYQHPSGAYSRPSFQEPIGVGSPCLEPVASQGWYGSEPSAHQSMQKYVRQSSTKTSRSFERTVSKPERQITVIELSDDEEEPARKAARLEIPSVDEIRRREDEIIEFWESRFVRYGSGHSETFPEIFLLKDAFDLDKCPLGGLKRFFMNVPGKQASLCFETSSAPNEEGCPGRFMARCRWAPDQSWFTGYGESVEHAKNEAAKLALISILGPEEFELIVDMSKSQRYEGLDRKRINAALRRRSLMTKYRGSNVNSFSSSVSTNSSQGSPLSSHTSSTGQHGMSRAVDERTKKADVDFQPTDTVVGSVSSNLLVLNKSDTGITHQEAFNKQCELSRIPPVDCDMRRGESSANKAPVEASADHFPSLGRKTSTEGLQGTLSDDCSPTTNIIFEREEKLSDGHKNCKSDGADISQTSCSRESLKSSSAGDIRKYNPVFRKEAGKQSFDISQWSNSNNPDAADEISLGGSGTDLSDDETECDSISRPSPKLRSQRLENKIIKFWFDRMIVFRGKKQLLNVFELHKLRNLKKNAKKAVSTLFNRICPRPEFKVLSVNSESFSVQCSWQDVCVLGAGKTISEAENEASNEILREVLRDTEYRRLCQMTEESLYLDLDVDRINRRLSINTAKFSNSSEKPSNESNFDFQFVSRPKRLKLFTHPLTKASLQTESSMLTTKLRARSVNQSMKQKFRSAEEIASLQEFSRLENIKDLEKNAVAALGSLFAKLDEPCPVYTCVPYMDSARFKVECVVRGKYFVAEDCSEEVAKNAAAVMALKFFMGMERFQEQNENSRSRTLEEESI